MKGLPIAATTATAAFAGAMLAGLRQRPRAVAPKFFYDAEGSALFERICELPEYYLTRTELGLLERHGREMAELIGPEAELLEFGAGSQRKIRLLLQALRRPAAYRPLDISAEHLLQHARQLADEQPQLRVEPLVGDFCEALALPLPVAGARSRVGFFPGSSIGNFSPDEALQFLRRCAGWLRGGGLLVGVDLVKDPALLHQAYNDDQGVTAAFNRNLLVRANHELGADFVPEAFHHHAFYEPRLQRIEMHLLAARAQSVNLCGERFVFEEGESLHTEVSCKYTLAGFTRLAEQAGLQPVAHWCDPRQLFSVHWLAAPA